MKFDAQVILSQLPWLLKGAELTLSVSLLGIVFGVVVGIALALALQTTSPPCLFCPRLHKLRTRHSFVHSNSHRLLHIAKRRH